MDLVTGGAGFIGSHLVEELLRRGRRVRVLDDFSTGRWEHLRAVLDDIEVIEGDILDPAALRTALRGVQRVFHQAARRSASRSVEDPGATNRVNVDGTLRVLLAARDAQVERVVYASSAAVYGPGDGAPLREHDPAQPVSPYGVSKLAGEHYARAFTAVYGLPTVGLRYFNVFGPRQSAESRYAPVVPRFIAAALRGESLEIHGDGLQSRDFTYVDNVVLATCLAGDSDGAAGEIFNVAGGRALALLDIVEALGRLRSGQGRFIRWHHTPPRAGDIRHSVGDIDKARRLLGYEVAVEFDEGLRRTVDAIQAEEISLLAVPSSRR